MFEISRQAVSAPFVSETIQAVNSSYHSPFTLFLLPPRFMLDHIIDSRLSITARMVPGAFIPQVNDAYCIFPLFKKNVNSQLFQRNV